MVERSVGQSHAYAPPLVSWIHGDHVDLAGAALLVHGDGDESNGSPTYLRDPDFRLATQTCFPDVSGLRCPPVRIELAEYCLAEHLLERHMDRRPRLNGERDYLLDVARHQRADSY